MIIVYKRKEAALMLKISEDTLDRLVKTGRIDSTMVGGRRRFFESHLNDYLKRLETKNTY